MHVDADEIRDLGQGTYLVRGHLRMKHVAADGELESPYEQRFEVRDGYLVRGRMITGQAGSVRDTDDVETVRRFVDAFNRRELAAVIGDLDPDVELHEWPEAPEARTYRGADGVQEAIDGWFETWSWMHVEIVDVFATGNHVFVTLHQRAEGRGSEAQVELTSHNVYTFRDGKVVRVELFTEREPALAAAGLR
jgi:ketosteroid isomerase-like protein